MRTYTVRQALDLARARGLDLEAVTSRAYTRKSAAEQHVPHGGLLVREPNGYVPLELVARRAADKAPDVPDVPDVHAMLTDWIGGGAP